MLSLDLIWESFFNHQPLYICIYIYLLLGSKESPSYSATWSAILSKSKYLLGILDVNSAVTGDWLVLALVNTDCWDKKFMTSKWKCCKHSFCSNCNFDDTTRSQFFTYHNRWTVVVCPKLYPDLFMIGLMSNMWFTQFRLWARRPSVKYNTFEIQVNYQWIPPANATNQRNDNHRVSN